MDHLAGQGIYPIPFCSHLFSARQVWVNFNYDVTRRKREQYLTLFLGTLECVQRTFQRTL